MLPPYLVSRATASSFAVIADALEQLDKADPGVELIVLTAGQLADRLIDHEAEAVRDLAGRIRGLAERATCFGRDLVAIRDQLVEDLEDLGAALRLADRRTDPLQ